MPARDMLMVQVTPLQARLVAQWLRTWPQSAGHLAALFHSPQVLDTDVPALARQFEKVGRQRGRDLFATIAVRLRREDAKWLSQQLTPRVGMFGAGKPAVSLPDSVTVLSFACRTAVQKGRGRPRLTGDTLDERLARCAVDERHRKRLRSRRREEEAWQSFAERWLRNLEHNVPANPTKPA
jgi:hypothetical protein